MKLLLLFLLILLSREIQPKKKFEISTQTYRQGSKLQNIILSQRKRKKGNDRPRRVNYENASVPRRSIRDDAFERCFVGAPVAVSALFQSGRWAQLNRRFERNPALLGSGDKAKLVRMLALIPTGVNGVKTWTVRGRSNQRRGRPLDPWKGLAAIQ